MCNDDEQDEEIEDDDEIKFGRKIARVRERERERLVGC